MTDHFMYIATEELSPDPAQPRKSFPEEAIARLAASISARGMLLPLRVRLDKERQSWILITGECRWRAAKMARIPTVPCIASEGELSETDILSDQIIENAVRSDLRPLEFSRALAKLKILKSCTSQQLSKELGLSGAAITRAEALLGLPADIQRLVDIGVIPESTAYEISRLPDEASMRLIAEQVAAGKLTRDGVAERVRETVGKRESTPKGSRLALKTDGIAITLTAGEAFSWEGFLLALDRIRKEARALKEAGGEFAALAKNLKPS